MSKLPDSEKELVKRIQEGELRRRKRLAQIRHTKKMRRRRRLAFFIFALLAAGLIWVCVRWIRRTFFTSVPDSIPSLRQEANEHVLDALVVSDTSGRGLSKAEKQADLDRLVEMILRAPRINSKSKQDGTFSQTLNTLRKEALETTNDDAYFAALEKIMNALGDPKSHMITLPEYRLLEKNVGHGFYEAGGAYAAAIQNPRVQDRYQRMSLPQNADSENASSEQSSTEQKSASESNPSSVPTLAIQASSHSAVISNFSFEDRDLIEHQALIRNLFEQASQQSTIILDLRNTSGTSIEYWTQNILPCFAKGAVGATTEIYFPMGFDDYIDYLSLKETMPHFDLEDRRAAISMLIPQAIQNAVSDLAYSKRITVSFDSKDAIAARPVQIQIDETTSGAAETFVDFCQLNHLATIIGSKSAGGGWDIPPVLIPLEHSGFLFALDITASQNPAGNSMQETTGVVPMR